MLKKTARYMKYVAPIILINILCFSNAFAQKGKIKGVVTYFFNEYQGNKPDLGAEVYAIDSMKCPKYNGDISFQFELASIKGNDDEDFKTIDKQNALNNKEIIDNEDANKTTVDASGNYFIELPPSTYFVLIKSKGRNGLSMSELMGKVYIIKIKLKPDQVKDVSYNFPLK